VKGGASVLKLQAACGFLAFAQLRLMAGEPEIGELGFDALESGSVLHEAMQIFWKATETQDALRRMTAGERDARLMEAIDASLPKRLRAESGWDLAYVEVVKQRFLQVLRQWLEMELQRGPFRVVSAEEKQEIPVGPLTLSVRMDRIDQVEGGFVLVDYKSGASGDPKEWEGDRPDDAQLPLYALQYQPEELKGMVFAKVRVGKEMKWTGVQAEAGILPKATAKNTRDIGALVEEWSGTLTVLAEDFARGRAEVRPKSYAVNCARCGQRLLCRLDPTTLLAAEDDGDDEEDLDG
jgi:ATP-dependent helicase/nuclease subunit B